MDAVETLLVYIDALVSLFPTACPAWASSLRGTGPVHTGGSRAAKDCSIIQCRAKIEQ